VTETTTERRIPAARIVFDEPSRDWIKERVGEILSSGALTLGKHTTQFENEFAAYIGIPHAVAVNSGTSALEIALRSFGVSGKEVIVPDNTFFATAAAVVHAGGRPRLVDIRLDDLTPDVRAIEAAITPRTAGVIVVHIGGILSPRLPQIHELCRQHGLFLLEDAAHAQGSTLNGRFAGTFGDAAAFSFYPTKVMTSGEGGMLVTSNSTMDADARVYRDQGKAGFLENKHVRMGYNWRLSEIHAVLGLSQLRQLPAFIDSRRRAARVYDAALMGFTKAAPITQPAGVESNYYKYMLKVDPELDRPALKKRLREEHGVSLSGEVYELPLHRQPILEEYGHGEEFPVADEFCDGHICLPVYAGMTAEEAEYAVSALKQALA
jgi:dTDP-4-amino-4,6-dideoxygalactose transaminase